MTREEAIHKMEYSKRAYQKLIDEKVQEGVLVGQGINGEWSADTSIIDAYKDMLEACEMAIEALKQEPKTGHWIKDDITERSKSAYKHKCDRCGAYHRAMYDYCPSCGAKMIEPQESEGRDADTN